MTPHIFRSIRTAALATAIALPLGCGGDDLEEQLERASHAVSESRAQLEESRKAVLDKENAVTEAKAKLDAARAELQEARTELAEDERALAQAEERIYSGDTDALLFRAVQQRLLEDGSLKGTAVSAQVARGRVTLRGQVASERLRKRALEVASETPGVVEVIDEISVRAPAAKPEPAASAEGEAS